MTDKLCHTPTPCPLLLGKSDNCGHKVMHGQAACWRRDGRVERPREEGWVSPFEYEEGESRE
jgi:hypothetical protein